MLQRDRCFTRDIEEVGLEIGGSSWMLSTGRSHSRQWIQAIPQPLCRSTFQKFKQPVCGLGMQSTKQVQLGMITMSMLSCPRWLTCTTVPLPCLSPHDLGTVILLDHLSKITTSQCGIAEENSGRSCKPLLRPSLSPPALGAEWLCCSSDLSFSLIHFVLSSLCCIYDKSPVTIFSSVVV